MIDIRQHRESLLKAAATRVMAVLDAANERDHWLAAKKQARENTKNKLSKTEPPPP